MRLFHVFQARARPGVEHLRARQLDKNQGLRCPGLGSEAAKGGLTANKYKSATAICNQIAVKVKAGSVNESAARTLIRAQVQGVKIPGAC